MAYKATPLRHMHVPHMHPTPPASGLGTRAAARTLGRRPELAEDIHAATEMRSDLNMGTALGTISGATGGLMMLSDMFALPIISGTSKTFGLLGKGGDMIAPSLGKPFHAISAVAMKPHTFLTQTPVGELGMGRMAASAVGSFSDVIYGITSRLNGAMGGVFSKASTRAANKAELHLAAAHSLARNLGQVPESISQAVAGLLGSTQHPEMFAEAGAHLQSVMNETPGLTRKTAKLMRRVEKNAGKAHHAHLKSQDYAGMAVGKHNAEQVVKNLSVHEGISKGLWSASSIASVAVSAHETMTDMKMFRQLVADLKNIPVEDVTSGDAMFADLPHAGNVARMALLKAAVPKAFFEAINTVFNIKSIRGTHVGTLTFMAPILASQAVGMMTSGNILDVYKEMKRNELEGKPNMPEQYAQLIGMAHKELYQRDGGASNFAQEIGRIYAERGTTVKQTLQAVLSGQVDRELKMIHEHNTVEHRAEHAATHTEAETPSPMVARVDDVHANSHTPTVAKAQAEHGEQGFAGRVRQQASIPEMVRS